MAWNYAWSMIIAAEYREERMVVQVEPRNQKQVHVTILNY